jgi:hypothetical protein
VVESKGRVERWVGDEVAGVAVDDEHTRLAVGLPVEHVDCALRERVERAQDGEDERRLDEDSVVGGDATVVDVRRPAGVE